MINSSNDSPYSAMQALLAGPNASEEATGLATDIPVGTIMRGLQIQDGVATINLSPQFVTADPAASLSARLAEVVYTLTAYPSVYRVTIEVSSSTLENFADVDLRSPVGRSQVTAAVPEVLLEDPAVGDSLHGSLQISGLTTINGLYEIQLLDPTGRMLVGVTNTAVAGGAFAQTVPFTTSISGTGTLRVFARPAVATQPTQETEFTLPIGP